MVLCFIVWALNICIQVRVKPWLGVCSHGTFSNVSQEFEDSHRVILLSLAEQTSNDCSKKFDMFKLPI